MIGGFRTIGDALAHAGVSLVAVVFSTPASGNDLLDLSTHPSGDGEVKRRSDPKLAVSPEPTPMQAGNLFCDGEPETGACNTAGDAGFDPLEAIEDPG